MHEAGVIGDRAHFAQLDNARCTARAWSLKLRRAVTYRNGEFHVGAPKPESVDQ
jgi:hypothetical protein